MKLQRILTGIIGFPIVAAILILGNKYIIDAVFAIVALISIHEYFSAIEKQYKPVKWIGYIAAILIAFIHIIPIHVWLKILIMFVPTSIVLLFINIIVTSMKITPKDIFATFFGLCYVIGFLVFLPLLYSMPNGKFLIWYIFFAAWGTDTFAYAVGMKFGKHKLTKISPKKSIEGSIGGTVGAIIIALIYTAIASKYVNLGLSYAFVVMATLILSVLSQLGDLSASSIKREMEIKDYGNLIPGHGGMLDRIDSIIFVAPFAYFLLIIL